MSFYGKSYNNGQIAFECYISLENCVQTGAPNKEWVEVCKHAMDTFALSKETQSNAPPTNQLTNIETHGLYVSTERLVDTDC